MRNGRFALAAPYIGRLVPLRANTLTNLIPDLYAGLDVVSRELVGMIPAVSRSAELERAAVNETVRVPIVPAPTAFNITPAMAIPEPADQTIGNATLTISKSRAVAFGWTGEEQRGLNNGPGVLSIQAQQFAQGIRTLTNEIEADLCALALTTASRAVGTAGTTPFGSDLGDAALVRQVLDDNGAPGSGRALIINTDAGVNLRKLSQLTKVNEAGTQMTLRDGELLNVFGLSLHESAGISSFTKGTNNGSASTDNAGYAIGATVLTLASAGTGTIKAGDVITIAGDANKYVVASGDTDVSNGGTITLAAPGLRKAIAASNTVITTTNSHACNFGFSQNAIQLGARLPALPDGGDAADDAMTMVDVRSGLVFEIRIYRGYRKLRAEVGMAWGCGNIKSEHTVLLMG